MMTKLSTGGAAQADRLGREAFGSSASGRRRGAAALLFEQREQLLRCRPGSAKGARPSSNGSSKAAHFRWLTRISRLSGLTSPLSGERSKKYSGWLAMYWSSGLRRGDEDGDGDSRAAAGAAHLLPGAGDRAGIAGQHGGLEPADVDAQLQRVGGDDAADASRRAARARSRAARSAGSRRGSRATGVRLAPAVGPAAPRAGRSAAPRRWSRLRREDDRLDAARQEARSQAPRFQHRAARGCRAARLTTGGL